ncbi:glycoside hydrolase family 3 N-terminal domain-containing protein [Foetidibacter luteolus]|uniref:glycoside hydrolase family 3 N-terminal domain-containing protein n=1 Tax=Foetidibacter luteolus TaxID=2608880 RepID=UPI00129A19D7|nr:glycoside hydrolase family 3 N-terminal domain-containing protein [Foetidibacter luteolus]
MKKLFGLLICCGLSALLFSQPFVKQTPEAVAWVDSVFNTLNKNQKIAQLMIIRAHSNLGDDHVKKVTRLIKKYHVGGLCFFQGGPVRQANLTNFYQGISKVPLMITIDGEWGLGMRLDSVISFPRQLMMGAVQDAQLVYEFGKAVGAQCKRLGIHVNFAPDVDVNNNPANPVINDRSFGEDKYKVALFGVEYMKGLQEQGVLACAKHFPGHGDVAVDSHFDLPVINKSRAQLDSLELYPFVELIKAGVGSVMNAHLYVTVIDTTQNLATSISQKNVTGLLKDELGFKGLTFTDALEMKGVTKFYPGGQISLQSLIAGNDMLCLPDDIEGSLKLVKQAIKAGRLQWDDIDARVKKVLLYKYSLGLHNKQYVETKGLTEELNSQTINIKTQLANNAITLLSNADKTIVPLTKTKKVAFVGVGLSLANSFASLIKNTFNADIYLCDYKDGSDRAQQILSAVTGKYDVIVTGVHAYSRRPANNYGISAAAKQLINGLQQQKGSVVLAFGNPYAISNFCEAPNLFACYEDDAIVHQAAFDVLTGKLSALGKLPVTVCGNLKFGAGIAYNYYFPYTQPANVGMDAAKLAVIDSIANNAIFERATPGCVVLVAKDGKVVFEKAYGYMTYDSLQPISLSTLYDLASVTKISATTVSVMKLYEEGKLDINKTLGDYLPWVRGTNKQNLLLKNILLHQAGLVAFIPFYKETIEVSGIPKPGFYDSTATDSFSIPVAQQMYMRNAWQDTIYQRILQSPVLAEEKYIYSDNDFIFLGKIVEQVTGKSLAAYTRETFYQPLRMASTTFNPLQHIPASNIAPTEREKYFRLQQIQGYVHDPGAAMFGGIAGHAGLFSNAYDLAQLYQLLLNGGALNGIRLLKKETIDFFTGYHSNISRRGLGFDKPEKDNATRKDHYPASFVSPQTFGHTGFTGTCVWADPRYNLLYIFLSNRVYPTGGDNLRLGRLNVRSNIQDAIYRSFLTTDQLITQTLN